MLSFSGKMEFIIGYPAQKSDASDRFPCDDIPLSNLGKDCFGLYFFEGPGPRGLDQPQNRFTWLTGAYNGMPAGVLESAKANVVDRNPSPSLSRPDLEWTINNFNGATRFESRRSQNALTTL